MDSLRAQLDGAIASLLRSLSFFHTDSNSQADWLEMHRTIEIYGQGRKLKIVIILKFNLKCILFYMDEMSV